MIEIGFSSSFKRTFKKRIKVLKFYKYGFITIEKYNPR